MLLLDGKGDLNCLELPTFASTYICWATEHMRGRKEKPVFAQRWLCNSRVRQDWPSSHPIWDEFGWVVFTRILTGTQTPLVARHHYFLQERYANWLNRCLLCMLLRIQRVRNVQLTNYYFTFQLTFGMPEKQLRWDDFYTSQNKCIISQGTS